MSAHNRNRTHTTRQDNPEASASARRRTCWPDNVDLTTQKKERLVIFPRTAHGVGNLSPGTFTSQRGCSLFGFFLSRTRGCRFRRSLMLLRRCLVLLRCGLMLLRCRLMLLRGRLRRTLRARGSGLMLRLCS